MSKLDRLEVKQLHFYQHVIMSKKLMLFFCLKDLLSFSLKVAELLGCQTLLSKLSYVNIEIFNNINVFWALIGHLKDFFALFLQVAQKLRLESLRAKVEHFPLLANTTTLKMHQYVS